MSAPRVAWAIALRTWRNTFRRPVVLAFSFVQPLIWMTFFGFLFHRYPLDLFDPGISYTTFLAPGVAAMTVLFGASQAGILFVRDYQSGFLTRMLGTPAGAGAQLAGKVGADVRPPARPGCGGLGPWLGCGCAIRPVSFRVGHCLRRARPIRARPAFGAISCSVALLAKAPESMGTFVHIVNMPMLVHVDGVGACASDARLASRGCREQPPDLDRQRSARGHVVRYCPSARGCYCAGRAGRRPVLARGGAVGRAERTTA